MRGHHIYDDPFGERTRELGDELGLSRGQAAEPPEPSPTFEVYPKVGPWTGNNQLGNDVPFQPNANNRQAILNLNEWGFPRIWTVSLAIRTENIQPVIPGPPVDYGVTAEVLFGVGGAVQLVEIDWCNGVVFSVPANAIRVTAVYTPRAHGLLTVPLDLYLSAQAAIGTRGGTKPPFRTVEDDVPIGGPGQIGALVPIPNFANTLRVFTNATAAMFAAGNVIIFYSDAAGTVSSIAANCNDLYNWPNGVPIPNWAHYVQFFRGVAGIALHWDYVFDINL